MPFGPKTTAFPAAIRVMPNSSPEYPAAFQEALRMGCDALSDVAVTRATDVWEEPLVYQGKSAIHQNRRRSLFKVRRIDNQCSVYLRALAS